MQTAFLRLPLAKKLLHDNFIAIVIALSSALVFFLLVFGYMAQKNLRAASMYKASTLAANLDDSMSNTDPRQSNKLILNVSVAPDVLSIAVFDKNGTPKITWNRLEYFGKAENLAAIVPPTSSNRTQSSFKSDYFEVTVPIVNGLELTGFVQMQISLSSFYKDLVLYFVLGFLLLAIATLAGVYLLTQRQLVRLAPVFELSRIIEKVALSEDYSLRARHHDSNELGSLSQHFNKIATNHTS